MLNSFSDATVDLTNCDREPIHIPNAIQPHGVMLVMKSDLTIVQVSQNVSELLGRSPEALLHQSIAVLLNAEQISAMQACLQEDFEHINPLSFEIERPPATAIAFDGVVHQFDGIVILELEPKLDSLPQDFFHFYHRIKTGLTRIQQAPTVLKMAQAIVAEIHKLSEFERVMVYKFDDDGSGQVIAEVVADHLNPYLDLCYPPSDIPKQAKHLYKLNWLRIIPDAAYQPIPLVPSLNPATQQPTDLSLCVLRSVSPIHLEYLHNMGVGASLSISLLSNQKLWGLIACHHSRPKFISYSARTACEFLGQAMSLELATKEMSEDLDYKMKLKSIQSQYVESLSLADGLVAGLTQAEHNLLELVGSEGAAIISNDRLILMGNSPSEVQVQELTEWIVSQDFDNIFHTSTLSCLYPSAAEFSAVASGLMLLRVSRAQRTYILWFRPEIVQTVKWGGNPNKPVEVSGNGEVRLSPRKSFDLWQETVRGRSLPWKTCEIEAVAELRSAIVSIVMQRADELAAINLELQRSNSELDAFAYVASHDLKEPLRGIYNYSQFLLQDYEGVLDEAGVDRLQTLMRLTQRMEDLINSLLHYSRLGRAELNLETVDLNQKVQQAIEVLKINYPDDVEFRVPRSLPAVQADGTQVLELLTNLFSNAIKYNNCAEKWIEIGYLDAESVPSEKAVNDRQPSPKPAFAFYIKDNGIGIRDKHLDVVFRIFKRLHGNKQYGGGTGAGLTIVKKIVERHGGQIWVESNFGQGSTFYFTLPLL